MWKRNSCRFDTSIYYNYKGEEGPLQFEIDEDGEADG